MGLKNLPPPEFQAKSATGYDEMRYKKDAFRVSCTIKLFKKGQNKLF
jgi:hypothetical protein